MENIEVILSLSGTVLGLIIAVLTVVVKFVKNAKAKKIAEQAIEISNAVLPFIREAEKFTAYSGAEKKEYVITKANQFALVNHMPFDEEQVSEVIEELVALTKKVNVKTNSTNISERVGAGTEKTSWLKK